MARSIPSSPGQAAAWALRAARSKRPSGAWATTPVGAPPSRIRRVRRRVSSPATPMRPFDLSQLLSGWVERQLEGSVISAARIRPRAGGVIVSRSSLLAPTLPIWGKVKVMIWPA